MNEEEKARQLEEWRNAGKEPLNTELLAFIRPYVARMLLEYCVSNDKRKDVVVDAAVADFLFRRGF